MAAMSDTEIVSTGTWGDAITTSPPALAGIADKNTRIISKRSIRTLSRTRPASHWECRVTHPSDEHIPVSRQWVKTYRIFRPGYFWRADPPRDPDSAPIPGFRATGMSWC